MRDSAWLPSNCFGLLRHGGVWRYKIALVDGMIHQRDIRRPLGIGRVIPPDRLERVLDKALRSPATRGARKARGVRLIATDIDWFLGDGLEGKAF